MDTLGKLVGEYEKWVADRKRLATPPEGEKWEPDAWEASGDTAIDLLDRLVGVLVREGVRP